MASLAERYNSTFPSWWGKPTLAADCTLPETVQDRENENYHRYRDRPYFAWDGGNQKELFRQGKALAKCYASAGALQVQPTLRARVYAHDRIVLTAYEKLPKRLSGSKKNNSTKSSGGSTAALVKCPETRRGFKIGGRTRFKPRDTCFTVSGRNMVRDGGHIVEHYSEGIGLFLTTTIAGGTDEVYECMSAASGYIADRLNRWLREKVVDGLFVYVWELQRRGAPHMHYLFRVSHDTDVDDFRMRVSAEWRQILLDVSNESQTDLFARAGGGTWRDEPGYPRVDVRRIDGRFGGYLAKYASKRTTKDGAECIFRPGRWWSVSYPLRALINRRRLDIRLPLRSIAQGVLVAQTLIDVGEGFVQGSRWAKLPGWMTTRSASIQCEPKTARAVALALYYFVQSGEVEPFAARLAIIRANITGVKNNGPGSKTAMQELSKVNALQCQLCERDEGIGDDERDQNFSSAINQLGY